MHELPLFLPKFAGMWLAFALIVCTPGPANIAISLIAMRHGAKPALAMAGGVLTISHFYAFAALFGVTAIALRYPVFLPVLYVIGGSYFFLLACKFAKASPITEDREDNSSAHYLPTAQAFMQGVTLHLLNPKAVIVWLAMTSYSLQQSQTAAQPHMIALGFVLVCLAMAILNFIIYSLVFSRAPIRRLWLRFQRKISLLAAAFFVLTGCFMHWEGWPALAAFALD